MGAGQDAGPDLTRSSVARYLRLATLFRRNIERGDWRPGTRIPAVDELAAGHGVARATIRQALDTLEREGSSAASAPRAPSSTRAADATSGST